MIQFELDQLHDYSTDEQVVFMEWYTWVFYAASVTFQVMTEVLEDNGYVSVLAIYYTKGSMLCAVAIILITSTILHSQETKLVHFQHKSL